jgi:hypothetical protein
VLTAFVLRRAHKHTQTILKFFGEITRQGKERVVQLSFSPDATLFGCLGADKTLELFRVHPADEVRHRQKKRVKRTLSKKQQQGVDASDFEGILRSSPAAFVCANRSKGLTRRRAIFFTQWVSHCQPTSSRLCLLCARHTRFVHLI